MTTAKSNQDVTAGKSITAKFTPAEVNHIKSLLLKNRDDGEYYAPAEQYWARAERIYMKLTKEAIRR